jgi:bis(5'-adenosyl)-triphosphatase
MKSFYFGSFLLNPSQIFFESSLSLAIVNLKPIVPGHVLVLPKRVIPRLSQLTNDEHSDLFHSVRIVSSALEPYYSADAFNIAVQDGKEAGQSVYHVHVHILPRKTGKK